MKTIDEAAQNWLEGSIRGLNSREIKEVVDSIENPNSILKNNLLREIGYD